MAWHLVFEGSEGVQTSNKNVADGLHSWNFMFPQWKPSKEIFIEIKQESPDLIIELQMRNPSGSLYSVVNHLMQRSSNYNNNNKAKS